jgi:hypothetical protein
MITKETARELVRIEACGPNPDLPDDDEIIILDNETIEKPWGWVFFYTSKKWHETNDITYAIAGNAPVIVEKDTGKLFITGTAYPIDHYIYNYEKSGDPHSE